MNEQDQFLKHLETMSQSIGIISSDMTWQNHISEIFYPNGKLRPLPASWWLEKGFTFRRSFLHFRAQYFLPTLESIGFIHSLIGDPKNCIEVGAGNGWLGYLLGVRMTDSWLQRKPEVAQIYEGSKQPTIEYGLDVEKLDAISAVKKYKPDTVIASWVSDLLNLSWSNPYAIDEVEMMNHCRRYIFIGTRQQHHYKALIKSWPKTKQYQGRGLLSRSKDDSQNLIWVFEH